MKLSNGIRKALLVSMAALLAGSLVFTGCKGSDDSSDPIRQMILLQQLENAKTLQQKINEAGDVLDLGGAVKANDAVITKKMTLKNVNLGGKTLTVKASGVVLEGVQSAKIVVSKDIADGDFTMKNCAAIEKVTVNGGGSNSVHIEGSVVQSLAVAKAGVRIALEGKSRIESAAVKADGIILVGNAESTVARVALSSGVRSLALAGGTIEKIVSKTAVKLQIQGNGTKINQVKSSAAVQFEKADDVNDFEEVAIEALDDEDWDDADFEGWGDEDPEDEDGEDPEEEPVYQITSLVKPFSDAAWITNVYGSGVAADFVKGEQLKVAVTQADMDLVKYSNGIQAKHDITDVIADGKTYIVRFYITADVDAKAKWSVMSGEPNYQWYGGADLDLVAGERQKVEGLVDLNSSAASDTFLPSLKTTLGLDFLSVANFTVENIEFGEYTVVEVESVSLNETAKTIFVGDELALTATVAPEDATFPQVTWSSSDETVATVRLGKVKAVAHGKATITAKSGEKEATCEVTVAEFKLSETSHTIEPGASFELAAIVYPEDTEVTWASSNTDVAEYAEGHVIGKAEGTAKITATAMGKTLECEVTVSSNVIPVESVAFAEDGTTINVGDEIDLPAVVVLPENATNKKPTYTIVPDSVARITEEGKIVAVSVGTATLTASAEDKTDTYTITVEPRVIEQTALTSMKLFVENDGDSLIYKVESGDVVGAAEFTAGTKVRISLPVEKIYERGGVTARNVTMQVVDNSQAAEWWTIISDTASCELVEGQTAVWEATITSDITSEAKAVIFFQIPADDFTPATKKELLYVNAELPPESEPGVLFEDADGWSVDWSAKVFQGSDFADATNDSYLVFTVSKDTNKYYEQDGTYENCYAIIQMMYANGDKFGAGTSNTTVEDAPQLNLRGDQGLFADADSNTEFKDVEYHPTAEEWAEIKANGMKIQAHGVMFKKIAIK